MIEPQLPAGSRIGQYEIREFIARGGMAEVYLALDTELERPVAIKIMLPSLAIDEQYVERFRREARTVARLNHPNIVQIYGVGLTPETKRPYIAMQYVEGGSLDDILVQLADRNKLLPTSQVLLIARQVAAALAAAHNVGVIHRDLKPSNILIQPDGTPMLVDLGIAMVSNKTKLTQTGGFVGTPHYMSPEQVRGQKVDGRSDIYALGVMLYEMLAGRLPFADESPLTVLHKQAYETPVPLEKRRPDLPPQVLAIVATCLQKDPIQRFQRAEAFIQAVDVALQLAGSRTTIAQTTEVLTHLRDSALLNRQQVIRIPTGERPQPPVPLWAIATFVILAAVIGALFLFRPGNHERSLAAIITSPASTGTPVVGTVEATIPTGPTATLEPIIVVATNTAVPSPTTEPTQPPTAVFTHTPFPTFFPTNTPIPLESPTATPNQLAGVLDLDRILSLQEINAPANSELSASLVNNLPVIEGQPTIEMNYTIRQSLADDYVGIESQGLNITDWRNYADICLGIINDGNYSGHLTVQFREESDETWKTDIPIGNITNKEVCVPLSTAYFQVQSSEKNKQIDLAEISKIAFYLGSGGRTEGAIYLYSIRLMP